MPPPTGHELLNGALCQTMTSSQRGSGGPLYVVTHQEQAGKRRQSGEGAPKRAGVFRAHQGVFRGRPRRCGLGRGEIPAAAPAGPWCLASAAPPKRPDPVEHEVPCTRAEQVRRATASRTSAAGSAWPQEAMQREVRYTVIEVLIVDAQPPGPSRRCSPDADHSGDGVSVHIRPGG